jgi:hypothetical protein
LYRCLAKIFSLNETIVFLSSPSGNNPLNLPLAFFNNIKIPKSVAINTPKAKINFKTILRLALTPGKGQILSGNIADRSALVPPCDPLRHSAVPYVQSQNSGTRL